MPKKSSSKKPTPTPEIPVVETEKRFSIAKKPGNEIDEIFSSKKRKKPEKEKAEDVAAKPSKMKKKNRGRGPKDNAFVDSSPLPRKRTGDGLVIYREEELGIGKANAGGTPLCPFDCECCF